MFIAPYICHYHLHLFKCKNAKNAPFIHWLPFSRCFTYWQSHSSFQIHSALATIGPKWKGLQALCIILATVVVGEGNIEVFVMNMRMFRQRKPPPSYTFIAQYIRLHIIQLACFCLPSITIVHDVILALGLRTFWQHCNNNGTKTMFLFLTMSGQSS